MVPVHFVADSANTYVSWDGDTQTVRISTNPQNPPTGTPAADGDYVPGQQLVLDAKGAAYTEMRVTLEPGALVAAAHVNLYTVSGRCWRLILGADPVDSNIPGVAGFDGARIKAEFIETNGLFFRPLVEANGEMNYNTYSKDAIGNALISDVKVTERDTSLAVSEATDQQWSQVQLEKR